MGGRIRIISANLCHRKSDPEAFADLVRETAADVVAVQELRFAQADALAEVLPHGALEPESGYHGTGVALRHPGAYGRLSMACRDASIVRLTPEHWPQLSQPLELLNVHIAAPHMLRTWVALWRVRQMKRLLAHLDATPERRRVIVGDFNSTPSWPAYRRMAERFEDAPLVHAERNGTSPRRTWPGWFAKRWIRIDHCFTNRVSVEHAEVVPIAGSDHCALVVDLAG